MEVKQINKMHIFFLHTTYRTKLILCNTELSLSEAEKSAPFTLSTSLSVVTILPPCLLAADKLFICFHRRGEEKPQSHYFRGKNHNSLSAAARHALSPPLFSSSSRSSQRFERKKHRGSQRLSQPGNQWRVRVFVMPTEKGKKEIKEGAFLSGAQLLKCCPQSVPK